VAASPGIQRQVSLDFLGWRSAGGSAEASGSDFTGSVSFPDTNVNDTEENSRLTLSARGGARVTPSRRAHSMSRSNSLQRPHQSDKVKEQNRMAQRRYRQRRKEKEEEMSEKSALWAKAGEENTMLLAEIEVLRSHVGNLEEEIATLRTSNTQLRILNKQLMEEFHGPEETEEDTAVQDDTEDPHERVPESIAQMCTALEDVDAEFKARRNPQRQQISSTSTAGDHPVTEESNPGLPLAVPWTPLATSLGCRECSEPYPMCAHTPIPLVEHAGRMVPPPWAQPYRRDQLEAMDAAMAPHVLNIALLGRQVATARARKAVEQGGALQVGTSASSAQASDNDELLRRWIHIASVLRVSPAQFTKICSLRKAMVAKAASVWGMRQKIYAEGGRSGVYDAENAEESTRTQMSILREEERHRLSVLRGLMDRENDLHRDVLEIAGVLTPWQSARMVCEIYPDMPDVCLLATALERLTGPQPAEVSASNDKKKHARRPPPRHRRRASGERLATPL